MQIRPLTIKFLNIIITIKMIMPLYFALLENSHDSKNLYPPSHFYKEYNEIKMKNVFVYT